MQKEWVPIRVVSYAGGRADERPLLVVIEGIEHRVVRLLSESIEESIESAERMRRFRVLTEQGMTLEILRDQNGGWYLVSGYAPSTRIK